MVEAVVFDTNVLPLSRRLTSVLWLSIRKLCETLNIEMVLPELVIHESVNLRRDRYLRANATFLQALREISNYFEAEPVYVPDVEEICGEWERALREAFNVVTVHGDDAAEALRREALRARPARGGRGGRDSAIWMTVLRLADAYNTVTFVSENTTDFATGKDSALHPDLAEEVALVSGKVTYVPNIDLFIKGLAESTENPILAADDVTEALRFEARDALLASVSGQDRQLSPAELDPSGLELAGVRVLRSYLIGEVGLALIDANGALAIGNPRDGMAVQLTIIGWIEFEPDTGVVMSGEVIEVRTA